MQELDRKAQDLVQGTLLGEVLDEAPVAVFVGDETLGYQAVNKAACELAGYTRQEVMSLRVGDLVELPQQDSYDVYAHFVRNGGRQGTWTIRRKDGPSVDVRHTTY